MSTTGKGFRYPVYTDTPDVPRDLGYLAADVDAYLDAHPGPTGPAGPANVLSVAATNTIAAGQNASVTISGTSPTQTLTFNIPRGQDGVLGGPGPSNVLTIGTVVTGAAGSSAVATITGTSPSQVLNFSIPKGADGTNGAAGATGPQGPKGDTGPKGDAAATISVGSTSTGNAGTQATVTNSGTSSAVVLNFTIPKGADGAAGATGPQGPAGADGAAPTLDPIPGKISLASPNTSATGVGGPWYPSTNNSYSLGKTSADGGPARQWSNVYSQNALSQTSDERSKQNINDSTLGLEFINKLRPVKYQFIDNTSKRYHFGLIAQEVKKVVDDLNIDDFGGWLLDDASDPESGQYLRYDEFISPLIKAVQELTARVKALEEK